MMKTIKDHAKNNTRLKRGHAAKKTIGVLLTLTTIMGIILSGCGIATTTSGKGMAAGNEIVIDLETEKDKGRESTEKTKEKFERESDSKEVQDDKNSKDDVEEESENVHKTEKQDKGIEDSETDAPDKPEEDREDEVFEEPDDAEVKSVYNTMVPPYMMPSSEELGDKKIVYLTFDDGPSRNITPQILDILKEEDVKATFFVIGNLAEQNEDLIKRAVEEGHVIANHSYSHNYKAIYTSTEAFMAEVKRTDEVLREILGNDYRTKYVRLPGGGFSSQYNPIKTALLEDGYRYITWNTVTNDAVEKNPTPERLFANFKDTLNENRYSVVLMHDAPAQRSTPESLRLVVDYLKKEGYEFRTFD